MQEGSENGGKKEVVAKRVRLTRREKEQKIVELYEAGYSYKEICKALRVAPKTIARVLREAEIGDKRPEIEERLSDLESRVRKLEGDLKELERRIVKLSSRLDEVVKAVKRLYREAIFV